MARSTKLILIAITLLALFLRLFRVGQPDFKEEEFTSLKAAAYLTYCWQDSANCRHTPKTLKSRFLALVLNNETIPNLVSEIYLWDFVKDAPSDTHYARAWPYLTALAGVYYTFGISEFTSRLIAVLSGTLLVGFSYFFARFFTGSKKLALLLSFLVAVSFPLIDLSRYARFYSLFGLVFLGAVYFIFKLIKKPKNPKLWLAAGLLLLFSYWLQLLTLLLPAALLIYSFFYGRKLFWWLLAALLLLAGFSLYSGINFFHPYFISLHQPYWQYLSFMPEFVLVVLALPKLVTRPKTAYLSLIVFTSLVFLIFFSKLPPASAYLAHLLPLILLLALISAKLLFERSRPLIVLTWSALIFFSLWRLAGGVRYLYFGRDDRSQLRSAYQLILDRFEAGDQIAGVQVRDYYLKDLPGQTQILDLTATDAATLAPGTFITWEKEKAVRLEPETIGYIKTRAQKLAGDSLDDYGVEIYFLPK
ncbi:MAG: Glycosyl transferase family 39 [Candidatus Beckwithbacteria bacterium GW2011_GWB1_47_15]|uniref:Glycosyl transferase family 39 n=1 Tax=Candidatus Beckwithbacteria bacterium GW2011_GWB1_47_15 TaxID=1618371 RepID=A0A0G1RX81_9BACT|nr:MAG: glycosyl transferase family protein [Candidatus Beckwithbacteria bacterium GW2011_GWC1_49_16]KKU35667.1 MAG: Glycosyl transferase family 39 [Candidatus Beckwithbacteria bacterium GW2011_GWA1_46_30]KKU61721.1 MAG: Glycosyl transferase family 39 [Candidatus Beckwithbacteria bacterium GW2011_GWB1_47_15]KKU72225.1 MAG: Glycosyl transferase family 39 [Candidatus Beckwithbacteria bacterium GW2011_GWA2_47_25]KKW05014.1 MAG: Glycosyl transferase family 39 [Candidatus Beckwithbacteria bacterium 